MLQEERLSHEDFKSGIAEGRIRFDIVDRKLFSSLVHEPYINIIGWAGLILETLLILTLPLLCFLTGRWILLLGFLGYFIATLIHRICISAQTSRIRIKRAITAFFLHVVLATIPIYFLGILHPISIIFSYALFEFMISSLTGNLWAETAIINLVKNADNYYYAIDNNIIKLSKN